MQKKIAFLTDTHLGEKFTVNQGVDGVKNLEMVLNDIRSKGIEEVICGGDIGDPKVNAQFIKLFDIPHIRFRLILGNHDVLEEVKKYYQVDAQFSANKLFYCEIMDGLKYIFLDSSAGRVGDDQLAWLSEQLYGEQQVLIFIHHPVLKVETPVDMEYPLADREKMLEVLLAHGNQVNICCGHYHMADIQVYKNIRQFISPAVSYQFVKHAKHIEIDTKRCGYSIIDILEEEINAHPVFLRLS